MPAHSSFPGRCIRRHRTGASVSACPTTHHVTHTHGEVPAPRVRVRRWQQADTHEIGRLWEQVLLRAGWTSHGQDYDKAMEKDLCSATLEQLSRAAARKQDAIQSARSIRAQLAAQQTCAPLAPAQPWAPIPTASSARLEVFQRLAVSCLVAEAAARSLEGSEQTQPSWRDGGAAAVGGSAAGARGGEGGATTATTTGPTPPQAANPTTLQPTTTTTLQPHEVQQFRDDLQRLRRRRMWACLVAETAPTETAPTGTAGTAVTAPADQPPSSPHDAGPHAGGSVCGYVLIGISQPLALLPPPFPTTTPLLLHIDGLAVCASARRRGVASALLAAAEKLAQRWGRQALWLEVDHTNLAAVQLYVGRGYRVVRSLGWPWRQRRKLLLCKDLTRHNKTQAAPGATAGGAAGAAAAPGAGAAAGAAVGAAAAGAAAGATGPARKASSTDRGVFVWSDEVNSQ